MDLILLIALLPIVFMIHDFEEIILFEPWLRKNRNELFQRFPALAKRIYASHGNLSTSAFAVAILHVFIAISACTFLSLYFNNYGLWFAAFMVYFLHLFMHIAQWLIYGKYVPVIITSLLSLPYCIYTFIIFTQRSGMHFTEMILWTLAGIIALAPLFLVAFYNARRFEQWKNKKFAG